MNPANYMKAIVATLLAGLGCAYIALNPDANGVSAITAQEWVQIAQVSLASFGTVYGIPNISSGKRVAF